MTGQGGTFNLEAYLHRIGYDGPRVARMEALRRLHLLHSMTIPFENLDPFLHQPVLLDMETLEQKLVHGGRGGYCFEQNSLFAGALKAFGFHVTSLAARVLWNKPKGELTPRVHMLLKVEAEGKSMICDVGFGSCTLTGPLELLPHVEQPTPHETFRLLPIAEGFRLEARFGEEWHPLYRFGLEEQFPCDHEVTNYYLSARPGSHFRRTLIAARAWEGGRYALSNARFTIRGKDGRSEQRELATVDEIIGVLRAKFLVTVSDREMFEKALHREEILSSLPKGKATA